MKTLKIERCPHCGGTCYLNSNYSYKTRSYFVYVKCDVCHSQGKPYFTQDEPASVDWNNEACISAIEAWNLRV